VWPKAELHAHLNGCVPPALFRDLLVEAGIARAEDIVITRDLMNLEPAHEGLRAYFKPWHLIRRLPLTPRNLHEIVDAAVARLRDDNITYAELRHSVVHVAAHNGFTVRDTLHLLLDALDEASVTHRVDARLIVSLVRHEFLTDYMPDLLAALQEEQEHSRLIGIDLAGDEEHLFDPEWERVLLAASTDCGLGVTVHAGETGNAENVRWAIETCRASRIGHGLAAAADRELLELIGERDVCIEVCMTSNFLTQWVPDLSVHPVSAFIANDLPFVLCSDNPQMHGKGLTAEYQLFEELFGRRDLLELMYARQRTYSFGL
jgi:adenosine deaminase